jgi:hypothetical protein
VGRKGRESVKYRIMWRVIIVWYVSAAMDGRSDWRERERGLGEGLGEGRKGERE